MSTFSVKALKYILFHIVLFIVLAVIASYVSFKLLLFTAFLGLAPSLVVQLLLLVFLLTWLIIKLRRG